MHRIYGAMICVVALMLTSLAGTNPALADSVVINITGQILPASCTVQSIPAVSLGDIRDVDMANVGNSSSPVAFQLSLTACPATTTKVTASFAGTADSSNGDVFRNATGTGNATGVGVQLLDADHGNATLRPGSTSQLAVSNSSATFNLEARAVTTTANPVTGNIDTSVTVTFTYQ